ncbi:hypothetical protein [Haloarchaeobius sp. TZWSO28]|uniref:hypothetical protein n=1 Tax=Haloarchaeobius sp. TZWSO28 TaxID=3446119 RepID=UPI003EB74774
MAVVADLEQRAGVGIGGIVLYVVLFAGGIAGAAIVGDVDTDRLLVLVTMLGYGVGLLGVAVALANLPRLVRIRLASVVDSRVAATGWCRAEASLRTPFSAEDAVLYVARVLENSVDEEPAVEDERNWSLATRRAEATPFEVRWDGRSLPVEPSDATLRPCSFEQVAVTAAGDELPDHIEAGCTRIGFNRSDEAHHRFEEAVVRPREQVFVLGRERADCIHATLVADGGFPDRVRGRVVDGVTLGGLVAGASYLGLLVAAGVL